jgi:hypothetical protein
VLQEMKVVVGKKQFFFDDVVCRQILVDQEQG